MHKLGWIGLFCLLCLPVFAQTICDVRQELPLQLMGKELTRNFKTLKKQKPPVYYLAYTYEEQEVLNVSASFGAVDVQTREERLGDVQARVGSLSLDNTRALKGERENFDLASSGQVPFPTAGNTAAFERAWWTLTEQATKDEQKAYSAVLSHSRTMTQMKDPSDDFVFPPKETFCQTQTWPEVDIDKIKDLLAQASKLPQGKKYVLDYAVNFGYTRGHRYFADSRGTRLKTPYSRMRLMYYVVNRTQDGMEIERFKDYNVSSADELPSLKQLSADIRQSLAELEQLSNAPEGEPFTAPTILKGKAAAVFVHEVLGHRLEGHRQKNESEGQTFTGKVGQQVISPLLTVVDDPTLQTFQGQTLRGHYMYDDEGVKSRPVTLIENGVLKNFLMASSPVQGFNVSNGHGRKELGRRAVARMGIVRATSSQTVPYEELEKMLLAEIKRQGKAYGFIVEDLGGGFTFTGKSMPQSFKLETKLVWRVYPDGRKEMVRGLDIVGTPLVSFNRVLAVGDDDTVFDGSCGAESGWVPQTNISPSLLLEALETERTQTSPWKPPLLPSPNLEKGGKK
ncbi:MAG: TldD/PmbA family protein [Elusimicrobiaceae bacterium]|nr:TldD/PmbA family protein [Elusimicrobiaceae bacterium]